MRGYTLGETPVEGALPDELVKKIIERLLRLGKHETAWGVYQAHVGWRRAHLLSYLSPEEAGFRAGERSLSSSD